MRRGEERRGEERRGGERGEERREDHHLTRVVDQDSSVLSSPDLVASDLGVAPCPVEAAGLVSGSPIFTQAHAT